MSEVLTPTECCRVCTKRGGNIVSSFWTLCLDWGCLTGSQLVSRVVTCIQKHAYSCPHVLTIKYLLYYFPACLSLTWLERGHLLRLARACRRPRSSRLEPQSVTAHNSYCSTVHLCAATTTSPPSSINPSYTIPPSTLYLHHTSLILHTRRFTLLFLSLQPNLNWFIVLSYNQ